MAADAVPEVSPAPAPPPATPAGGAASPAAAADLAALKTKLGGQLRTLLEDDQFLTLLATEYMRQQQRAMQQVRSPPDRRESDAPAR